MKKYIEKSLKAEDLRKEIEEFEKQSKFKIGDLVKLKGGISPIMTITDFTYNQSYISNNIILTMLVICTWYNKGRAQYDSKAFIEEALELYSLHEVVNEVIQDIRKEKI